MALRRDAYRSKECSIGKEDQDVTALRIGHINGATTIHGNSRGMSDAGIFEGKQRGPARFEFVHEPGARVREKYSSHGIGCKCDGRIELTGIGSFFSPCIEKFEWRRRWRLGRGICALRARNGTQSDKQSNQKAATLPNNLIRMILTQRFRVGNYPIPPAE